MAALSSSKATSGAPLKADGCCRPGVEVVFENLTVINSGSWGRPPRELLSAATGRLRSGRMHALLGPSGAGKSTLMDALARRAPAGGASGSVLYGGRQPTPALLQRVLAYVEQEDTLIDNLSVEEMLLYTCELRSPPGTPFVAVQARAEAVLRELWLQACRHTRIGGPWRRGVSGGERRRVSIGVALVASPSVILLDEPTSGLDSNAALQVVGVLRAWASDRCTTVLASVHQPSGRLLQQFDTLLMAAGGRLVYQGPNGPAAQLYLQQLLPATSAAMDGTLPLPDWLLDCLEQGSQSGELSRSLAAKEGLEMPGAGSSSQGSGCLAAVVLPGGGSSQLALELAKQPESRALGAGAAQLAGEQLLERRKGAWGCLLVLLKYRMRADYRSPMFLLPRVGDKLGIAIFIGTLYLGVATNQDTNASYNLFTMLYIWILLPGFAAVTFIPSLVMDTQLFVRERHAGLYPIFSYLASKLLGELLIVALISPLLAAFVWFLAGLSGSFLLFWLPYLAGLAIGLVSAYLCAAVSPALDLCIALLSAYVISVLLFTGLSIGWHDIPAYWKWYAVLSWMRYGWGAVMVNQFTADPRQFGGTEVLNYFSLEGTSAWGLLGIQCAFFLALFLLSWAALGVREGWPRWQLGVRGRGGCGSKRATRPVLEQALSPPADPSELA